MKTLRKSWVWFIYFTFRQTGILRLNSALKDMKKSLIKVEEHIYRFNGDDDIRASLIKLRDAHYTIISVLLVQKARLKMEFNPTWEELDT